MTDGQHQPIVSVIVPIFNVERYLPQCIESILGQTYPHLEVLLVDDGSTDSCPTMCDKYANTDSRVRVIHKANGGLSDARNAALDIATGQYVAMVDGDDHIAPQCIATLLQLIQQTGADMAVSDWLMFSADNRPHKASVAQAANPVPYRLLSANECILEMFYQRQVTNSACARLFNAKFFRNIRFPKGMLFEDMAVAYPLVKQMHTVVYTPEVLYFYRQRTGSITGHFSPQRADVLDILDNLEQQVKQEHPDFLPAVRSRQLSAAFNLLLLCPDEPQYAAIAERCWHIIKSRRRECFFNPHVRTKNKIGILCSLPGRWFFTSVFAK